MSVGTYTFLPWLRHGLANRIAAQDGDPGVKLRASVAVDLELAAAALDGGTLTRPIARTVELYGPGDVVGIESRAIVRTEPRHWITNFEPNYLAAIEFYDEDFPWRYTPAAPSAAGPSRLRPWIALLVLAEGEFDEASGPDRPLPAIAVTRPAALPAAGELWAWAHVHVNRSLLPDGGVVTSDDMSAVLPRLAAALGENPDLGYSRLVSPRRLSADGAYHAFVVPVFESGRLAGLGLDPGGAPDATHSAWADYAGRPEGAALPYYHRWFFRTGSVGDFEYLVRKLRPRPVDPRVGTRDVDVLAPGANLPAIDDADIGGVLPLGGALRVPDEALSAEAQAERERREAWAEPYPHRFQRALASLIDLADDYRGTPAADANAASGLGPAVEDDPDPLIVPPLYGRWHALTERLLTQRDGTPAQPSRNWVHDLNLDPRHRVTAGFGTRVVQGGQEDYMDAAWAQVGAVLEANARLRAAQLGREVAAVWHGRQLAALTAALPGQAALLTAPLHARVLHGGMTAAYRVATSEMPVAPLTTAMRRLARPGGRVARRLGLDRPDAHAVLVERVARGEITGAPPKQTPPGVVTLDEAAAAGEPQDVPAWLAEILRAAPWLRFAPLALALVVAALLLEAGRRRRVAVAVGVVVAGALATRHLVRALAALRRADGLREAGRTVAGVDQLPSSPDFVVSRPGDPVTPRTGGSDSAEAARFKAGLRDAARVTETAAVAGAEPQRPALDVATLAQAIVRAVHPDLTVPRRVLAGLELPPRLEPPAAEPLREVMAYPVLDVPMYRPLVDISAELFLPNIGLIEPDSITLLETNQPFVEAYMAGLNHELARELLWREYPTDQRGSPFRQFWDPSGQLGLSPDPAARERLRDVPPLHVWAPDSDLGEHDNRDTGGGEPRAEVVLTIRGELLKKYPNAVVYAHRARWQLTPEGAIDRSQQRMLEDFADPEQPARSEARTPLYEARVPPDIAFFGFDLTAAEARGETPEAPDDPGWFFVLKERPGEPRFGFDIERTEALEVWNDLAWPDVLPSGELLAAGPGAPSPTLSAPTEPEKAEQHADDVHVQWGPAMTASDAAYVLYQAPVLVGVHAAEMLTERTGDGAGLPRP